MSFFMNSLMGSNVPPIVKDPRANEPAAGDSGLTTSKGKADTLAKSAFSLSPLTYKQTQDTLSQVKAIAGLVLAIVAVNALSK